MISVYPFGSGSLYTASYAISSSYAISASNIYYVETASLAQTVVTPRSGSVAAVNICMITYEDYLKVLAGTHKEICIYPS